MERVFKTFQAGISHLVPLLIEQGFNIEKFKPIKDAKSLHHLNYVPTLIAHAIEHGNLLDFHTHPSTFHYRFLTENLLDLNFGWKHDEYHDTWTFYEENL